VDRLVVQLLREVDDLDGVEGALLDADAAGFAQTDLLGDADLVGTALVLLALLVRVAALDDALFARPVGRAEVHALVVTAVGLAPVQVHDRDAVVRHLRGKTPGGCPRDEPQREGHERDVDLVLRPGAVVFDPEHVQEGELDDDRDREDPDADLALRVTPATASDATPAAMPATAAIVVTVSPRMCALIPSTVSVAMVVSRLRGTKSRPIRASAEKLDGNTPIVVELFNLPRRCDTTITHSRRVHRPDSSIFMEPALFEPRDD